MKYIKPLLFVLLCPSVVCAQTNLITIVLSAPNAGYSIKTQSIYQDQQTTYIHAQIFQPAPGMVYAAVITDISDSVGLPGKVENVKIYISGKNWNWQDKNGYTFIDNADEFNKLVSEFVKVEFTDSDQ